MTDFEFFWIAIMAAMANASLFTISLYLHGLLRLARKEMQSER